VKRLDTKVAAAGLVALGAAYLVLSLALGRPARAEVPPDLTAAAADAGLDVWKAAAALVQEERSVLVDVRPEEAWARYHLPRARSLPGATADQLKEVAAGHPLVVVYAGKDEVAQKLVGEARAVAPGARIHYLVDGARAWYLAFDLPVPLFAESAPPDGYAEALARVKGWFEAPGSRTAPATVEALQTLARVNYQPSLLKSGKKAAAGGAKKKIGGGCG